MLRVGTILHGTYRVDGYLASGGFGNTYVATNIQFGERYAIKEFFQILFRRIELGLRHLDAVARFLGKR